MAGQSVCAGCGSEFISWGLLSLLTNVTRPPAAIVTARGDTPLDVMVMVALDGAGVGDGVGEGVGLGAGVGVGERLGDGVGELGIPESLPPHAAAVIRNRTATHTQRDDIIRGRHLMCAPRHSWGR
jgi:hypothetical protein